VDWYRFNRRLTNTSPGYKRTNAERTTKRLNCMRLLRNIDYYWMRALEMHVFPQTEPAPFINRDPRFYRP
jgi:hypothetical protein